MITQSQLKEGIHKLCMASPSTIDYYHLEKDSLHIKVTLEKKNDDLAYRICFYVERKLMIDDAWDVIAELLNKAIFELNESIPITIPVEEIRSKLGEEPKWFLTEEAARLYRLGEEANRRAEYEKAAKYAEQYAYAVRSCPPIWPDSKCLKIAADGRFQLM